MTRRQRRHWTLALVILAISAGASAQRPPSLSIPAIVSAANRAGAIESLKELTDRIGPRLTGSAAATQAADWTVEQMRTAGLTNPHLERFQLATGWTRGTARLDLTRPFALALTVTSYGWTGSTPVGGVDAAVVRVTATDMQAPAREAAWHGKVLLAIGITFAQLPTLVAAAADAHAVAVIDRDARPGSMPHTGPVGFGSLAFTIPVLDIVAEHQRMLERMLDASDDVRVHVDVQNAATRGPIASSNVVGEIRGTDHPDETVIVAAHLDSWDLAPGAIDDGFGVAAVLGAARTLVTAGAKPRRTIRFILFTGEEQGLLGSRAYVAAHSADLSHLVCAFALDWGQGPITQIPLAGHRELATGFREMAGALQSLQPLEIGDGYLDFTDAYAFSLAGAPGIALYQQSPDYSQIGHSAADTLDKVDPEVLTHDTAILAALALWTADYPTRLGQVWSPAKTAQVLTDDKQRQMLQALHLWPF